MNKDDDQVRDLFRWIKNEEFSGNQCAEVLKEIESQCRRRGLQPKIKLLVNNGTEITFQATKLVLQHSGLEWQLVELDDPKV